MKIIFIIMTGLLAASFGINIYFIFQTEKIPIDDEIYVRRSMEHWSEYTGITIEELSINRVPRVLNEEELIYVTFEFREPALGGVPIYCYDAATDELIFEISMVE